MVGNFDFTVSTVKSHCRLLSNGTMYVIFKLKKWLWIFSKEYIGEDNSEVRILLQDFIVVYKIGNGAMGS